MGVLHAAKSPGPELCSRTGSHTVTANAFLKTVYVWCRYQFVMYPGIMTNEFSTTRVKRYEKEELQLALICPFSIILEFQDLLGVFTSGHGFVPPKFNRFMIRYHFNVLHLINITHILNKIKRTLKGLFQQLLLTVTFAFWFPPAQWPPTWQSVLKDILRKSMNFLPHRQSNMFPRFCLRRHKVPSPPQCCQIHRSSHIYKCHLNLNDELFQNFLIWERQIK